MKFKIISVVFLVLLGSGCSDTPAPSIVYVPVNDSTQTNRIVVLEEELRRCRDSLEVYKKDTAISADLFEARYKLERIKYYNDIAKKGNNIKYLRGWINRVLDE